jgi:transcriptional regulator with XRE-family HTH domain
MTVTTSTVEMLSISPLPNGNTKRIVAIMAGPRKASPDQEKSSFGAYLRGVREQQRLSVRQLAALIEVVPSQVLRWESGRHLPKAGSFARLSAALQVRERDLYQAAGVQAPRGTLSLPAMLRRDYDLPPEAIAEIQRNIERVARKYADREIKEEPTRKEGR